MCSIIIANNSFIPTISVIYGKSLCKVFGFFLNFKTPLLLVSYYGNITHYFSREKASNSVGIS